MDDPAKLITYICAFKAPNGLYLRIPSGGGELEASSNGPDDYSTFYYDGYNQFISSKAFSYFFVGCNDENGVLTTVNQRLAVPFSMAHGDSPPADAASTMTGQMIAFGGKYKGQMWYYLGAFKANHIQMTPTTPPPPNPLSAIFTLKILDMPAK